MNEQKERLEKELRFLKESLEAGVITEEEYGKGKQRIEQKLKEIFPKEEKIEITELKGEKPEVKVEEPIVKEEMKEEKEEEFRQEKKWEVREEKEEVMVEKPDVKVEEPREEVSEEKEGEFFFINKKALFTIGIIALIIAAYFLIRIPGRGSQETLFEGIEEEEQIKPICVSDDDCREKGKIGICQNPNTKEASCLFKDPIEVKLIIINDKNCISCDTSRMIDVLKQLFVTVDMNELDYKTREAENIISELNIDALPAYIFDSKINETVRFEKFKRALVKIGDKYVILPTASGANYFFNREEKKNKLELFTLSNDTQKLDNNLREVLNLFEGDIDYSKKLVSAHEKKELKEELAITTYPVFLVNNKLKFSGVQPADTVKEKFCELNKLEECSVTLSKDIK